jgi:hypothetical protein
LYSHESSVAWWRNSGERSEINMKVLHVQVGKARMIQNLLCEAMAHPTGSHNQKEVVPVELSSWRFVGLHQEIMARYLRQMSRAGTSKGSWRQQVSIFPEWVIFQIETGIQTQPYCPLSQRHQCLIPFKYHE